MNIKFDLIIANTPYGAPGANIVKGIIDNIDFDEFVNLLPANDYVRNDSKDLFKYARDMESIKKGFDDATVTTHLCRIVKEPLNITYDEFEISQYIDRQLDRYFRTNLGRKFEAIDNAIGNMLYNEYNDINKFVLLDHRCIAHKHLAYSKATVEYRWNVLKDISITEIQTITKTVGKNFVNKFVIKFDTELEKINFINFLYSTNGFKFISKVMTALNKDSTVDLTKWLPKVDWTRAWTVEEILADYGYTEAEIKEIMDDLVNFKGMDD